MNETNFYSTNFLKPEFSPIEPFNLDITLQDALYANILSEDEIIFHSTLQNLLFLVFNDNQLQELLPNAFDYLFEKMLQKLNYALEISVLFARLTFKNLISFWNSEKCLLVLKECNPFRSVIENFHLLLLFNSIVFQLSFNSLSSEFEFIFFFLMEIPKEIYAFPLIIAVNTLFCRIDNWNFPFEETFSFIYPFLFVENQYVIEFSVSFLCTLCQYSTDFQFECLFDKIFHLSLSENISFQILSLKIIRASLMGNFSFAKPAIQKRFLSSFFPNEQWTNDQVIFYLQSLCTIIQIELLEHIEQEFLFFLSSNLQHLENLFKQNYEILENTITFFCQIIQLNKFLFSCHLLQFKNKFYFHFFHFWMVDVDLKLFT
jgi:hypothetical protein